MLAVLPCVRGGWLSPGHSGAQGFLDPVAGVFFVGRMPDVDNGFKE